MQIKQEVQTPTMPSKIYLKQPVGKRQDGWQGNSGIPIENLTRQQAEDYAELMKQTFISHWEKSIPQSNGNGNP